MPLHVFLLHILGYLHWHVCSVMTLTACRLRANVGLRVMWTLMIIPFALNHHTLRVHCRRLNLSMSTMWIRLRSKPSESLDISTFINVNKQGCKGMHMLAGSHKCSLDCRSGPYSMQISTLKSDQVLWLVPSSSWRLCVCKPAHSGGSPLHCSAVDIHAACGPCSTRRMNLSFSKQSAF